MSRPKKADIFIPNVEGKAEMIKLTKSWLEYIRLRKSFATYRSYLSAMRLFIDNLPTNITPEKVTSTHIEKFLHDTIEHHTVATANTYLMCLKSFYSWCSKFHNMKNIAKVIAKLRLPKPNRRIISEDEYKLILKSTFGLDKKAIQFLANTGLRRDEFRSLTWENFNGDFIHVHGKGAKDRFVPLNTVCKKALGKRRTGDKPSFVKPFNSHNSIYSFCERISNTTGIPHFTPHSFRHFFATRLIRKGVPLTIVSEILGHADTLITQKIYVHLVPTDLQVTDILTD